MSRPVAVLEMGTSEVRVLVAEPREDTQFMITGLGVAPSRGIRKSELTDFDNALASLRAALRDAEQQSATSISEVMLVFSGCRLRHLVNRGTVTMMTPNAVIQPEDIEDAVRNARAVNLPPDCDVVHSIYQHFYIDDKSRVVNPSGMVADNRLSMDMLILYAFRNSLSNLLRVVEEAGLEVGDVAFGGLCSALAVLTQPQKEGGAIVIDLGAGTTDYLVYADRVLARAGCLAVGGDHVTNDIALGLNLSTAQAERLKIKQGGAMVDLGARDRKIQVPPDGGFRGKEIQSRDVNTIMHARMQETFELVKSGIGRELLKQRYSAGVVLTGGGARMPRITELASQIFEMPCHIGFPKGVSGLAMPSESPETAAVVGMLRYGMREAGTGGRGFKMRSLFKNLFNKS